MLQNLKKRNEGFTIVEVMIVLAIAGLIILIVFLAVPALQRTSRNTQRKQDAATYLAAVNEYMQNTNGTLPTTATIGTVNGLAKLGALTAPAAVLTGPQTTTVGVDTLQIVTGAKCDTAAANIGNTVPGPTRAFAVRYSVENSSGAAVKQCVES